MERVLVTGVTGKTGTAFIRRIAMCERGTFPYTLRLLVRQKNQADWIRSLLPEAEIFQGDLQDQNIIAEATKDVNVLFHIANIRWSLPLLQEASKNRIRRAFLVHTTGIYSKYKSAGEGYRQIEEQVYAFCKQTQVQLTILRPTMIYGTLDDDNVSRFIKMVDRFPIMPVIRGARYTLQPVYYEDLGEAYYQLLLQEDKTRGQDFVLSGDSPIELRDMLILIGQQLGKRVHFLNVPFPIAYAGAIGVYWLSGRKVDYREKVQRLCESRAYSHEDATRVFGYAPRKFSDGIVPEIQAYKAANRS